MNIVYLVILALFTATCAFPVTNDISRPELELSDVIVESRGAHQSRLAGVGFVWRIVERPAVDVILLPGSVAQWAHDKAVAAVTGCAALVTGIHQSLTIRRLPDHTADPAFDSFWTDVQRLQETKRLFSPRPSAAGWIDTNCRLRFMFFIGEGQTETQTATDLDRARGAVVSVLNYLAPHLTTLELEGGKLSVDSKLFGAYINTEFTIEWGSKEDGKPPLKGPGHLWLSIRDDTKKLWFIFVPYVGEHSFTASIDLKP
ncbi:hypothetical protein FB446DRAFT_753366 [Lentinula raphanica]|nr:hypothetical protein FB446DRAFT_753366 [Lentinula raphanica]